MMPTTKSKNVTKGTIVLAMTSQKRPLDARILALTCTISCESFSSDPSPSASWFFFSARIGRNCRMDADTLKWISVDQGFHQCGLTISSVSTKS